MTERQKANQRWWRFVLIVCHLDLLLGIYLTHHFGKAGWITWLYASAILGVCVMVIAAFRKIPPDD